MVRPTTTLSSRARFTVFTLVQDWIFEENQALYQQSLAAFNERVQLELALRERDHENQELRARIERLEFAVDVMDHTNHDLRRQVQLYQDHVGRCLHCDEPFHAHFAVRIPQGYPRRVRRRLFENVSDNESSSDEQTTEPEELPSDEDDVEL